MYAARYRHGLSEAFRDHLPEGKLWSMVIRTGNDTNALFISMVGYIEVEITTLGNLNIQDNHILLLLSNQVVRMCDNIHEIRTHGSRSALDNLPLAAAHFASVTLWALTCMNTFAKAWFKDHPATNSAYMRFLTCSIASQSNIGIKELLDSLSKQITKVEKIAADAATKESVTKVDNKVVALQRTANQGGGGSCLTVRASGAFCLSVATTCYQFGWPHSSDPSHSSALWDTAPDCGCRTALAMLVDISCESVPPVGESVCPRPV